MEKMDVNEVGFNIGCHEDIITVSWIFYSGTHVVIKML